MSYRGKRALDIFLAATGTVALSPILVLIALVIAKTMGRPVLFRQVRPGLHDRPFTIYKFRTMRDAHDSQGFPLPDEQRLTAFGRFLRATSLDELPELFNVLRGEMSIVGPRPLLMKYVPYYTEFERQRSAVLPGITGWAQVSGRNALPWDQRLAHDVWYVQHCSFRLDVRIIRLTVLNVLRQRDVHVLPRLATPDLDEERGPLRHDPAR